MSNEQLLLHTNKETKCIVVTICETLAMSIFSWDLTIKTKGNAYQVLQPKESSCSNCLAYELSSLTWWTYNSRCFFRIFHQIGYIKLLIMIKLTILFLKQLKHDQVKTCKTFGIHSNKIHNTQSKLDSLLEMLHHVTYRLWVEVWIHQQELSHQQTGLPASALLQ